MFLLFDVCLLCKYQSLLRWSRAACLIESFCLGTLGYARCAVRDLATPTRYVSQNYRTFVSSECSSEKYLLMLVRYPRNLDFAVNCLDYYT